ncbi:hypothetical protein LV164_002606 [Aspergillus fumigatus]|nr:hypothetical protein KXV47_000319 [Aspergillus fumigatus]KAH2770790.1 hypothetical protein KXV94_006366 [Aspergillus fumigatus]KAH3027002.1 hypothetical protein KXW60_007063 [Aspergillus fumigatus]KAH3147883.1 hypothetical protein KXW18_004210 [Aspergillus fumigatus]KAH3542201.1 hypothetical protein KXV64_002967 [Aspergillus fumigatus]
MSSLQVEITKTLRNLDDHMGNLLCLATLARISLSWDTNAEREHGPQYPTWLQNVKHFFGQKRGLKTLDLVILRVILACSASCDNLPPRKAAESIRLAIEICDSVEQGQKDCWIANNAPKIAKLCEKINKNGIDWQVQMMKMEEVCFDLEQRCTTIEAPLRAVKDERDQIAVQAEQLKQQKSELELQLQQASGTISELQQEIFHLENHARSTSARVEELSTCLDTARRELEDQRRTSQETTNSEREKARTRELDLLASITEKDDQIEELQEETRNLREDNNALRQILDTVSKEKNTSLEHTAALKQDVVRLEQCVEHGKLLLAQRDEEMSRLQADQGHMKSQMEALKKKLDEESAQVQELKAALRNAEETHRTEVNTLKKQYESQISEITVEYTENKGEMKALQAVMHAAASSATKELQAKERRIQHLERKVQQLRDERALKAREFSEAQQHIGRLMSVMGFKPGPREPKAASKQQCSGSTLGPLEAVTIQQQTAQRDEDPQSQSQNMLGDSFASPTPQSGRSPKRFRTTAADQDLGESRTQSQARPRRNRQALGEANRNKQTNSQRSGASQCTPNASLQGAQAGPSWDENHFHDIDLDMDLEFSKDFVFTSTALSEANDHIPSLRSQQ